MQSLAVSQDTALSCAVAAAPAGLGTVWKVHLAPSQRSATGADASCEPTAPTASQATADTHEIPVSVTDVPVTLGLGVVCTRQPVPSHISISGAGWARPDVDPAATQNVAETHDTAANWPSGLTGTGRRCRVQRAAAALAPKPATTSVSATTDKTRTRLRTRNLPYSTRQR
jgi:hypothetical protein